MRPLGQVLDLLAQGRQCIQIKINQNPILEIKNSTVEIKNPGEAETGTKITDIEREGETDHRMSINTRVMQYTRRGERVRN